MIDMTGKTGPELIVQLRRTMKSIPLGRQFSVLTDAISALRDIPAFLSMHHHSLIMVRQDHKTYKFDIIKKTPEAKN